ncbi:MAG: transcriptional repressor [Chloroflexi bacterium]|nr:transcriptional repressor [Chloroflexota bacterium]
MDKHSHNSYDQTLRQKGYRLTPQRAMVLEAIEHATSHISTEEIYTPIAKKYPNVNISTVYRTLELLTELSLVTATNMGDGTLRYHASGKGRHHHLICNKCGKIIDINEYDLQELKDSLLANYGFAAELKHVAFFGCCPACTDK